MAVSHELPLIATVSVGMALAFVAGFAALRAGLPPLVGYLVAGIIVGPFTPGFVADSGIAGELAEIGVILLMFGVGTHFSIRDLWEMRRIAVPGAIVQIAVATVLGAAIAMGWWGWSMGGALVFGLSLSVASTVVLLRALQDRGLVDSVNGRIAVGWLVVEDLAMVLALILLPAVAGFLGGAQADAPGVGDDLIITIGWTFLKIGLFFALIYGLGMQLFPWFAAALARASSRELITVFVVVLAISLAYAASALFGVSFALGAFLAGVVVNESGLSKRFSEQTAVLEHIFAVMFFVSVGMVFNPAVLLEQPLRVLAVLGIIMFGKSIAAWGIVRLLGYPRDSAWMVSASLAQIGEFSFILAGLGLSLNLLPPEGRDLILAGALLSITLNPLMFSLAVRRSAKAARDARPEARAPDDAEAVDPATLRDHVVLVGYGRVGRVVGKQLARAGQKFVVVELNPDRAAALRKRGWIVVEGDATNPSLAQRTGLGTAKAVVLAIPNADEAGRIFELARKANPQARVIVRCPSEEHQNYFLEKGATRALMAEHELGRNIARQLIEEAQAPAA